jgi:curved DNA-binding protein CbpA
MQDKNDASQKKECERMFRAISEAYECLKDPEARAQYDRFGLAGARDGAGAHASHFSFAEADDIFRAMFGGRDPFANVFSDASQTGMPAGHGGGFSAPLHSSAGSMGSMFAEMDRMMGMMGGGFGGDMGGGMSSFTMSSSSSTSTSAGGAGGGSAGIVGQSSHMETVVRNGKRVTRTVKTVRYADGRTETSTDEREDDASSGDPFLLGAGGFGAGGMLGGGGGGAGRLGYM